MQDSLIISLNGLKSVKISCNYSRNIFCEGNIFPTECKLIQDLEHKSKANLTNILNQNLETEMYCPRRMITARNLKADTFFSWEVRKQKKWMETGRLNIWDWSTLESAEEAWSRQILRSLKETLNMGNWEVYGL